MAPQLVELRASENIDLEHLFELRFMPGAPHLAFEMWDQIRAQHEPRSLFLNLAFAWNYALTAHNRRTADSRIMRGKSAAPERKKRAQIVPKSAANRAAVACRDGQTVRIVRCSCGLAFVGPDTDKQWLEHATATRRGVELPLPVIPQLK